MNGTSPRPVHPYARSTASKFGLILLIMEGYVYLVVTVLIFAAIVTLLAWGVLARHPLLALVALFVGLPSVALTFAAIRSLVFRVPEPRGFAVTARDAPAFTSLIEEVRRLLGSPRIDRVIIGTAFNASVGQVPRLAIFWPRNTLVIGFPLLVSLTPEQLRTVVAHELAHVFHAHGRVAGWVFRTRLSWMRLAAALNERGTVPIFVRWFLATYVPRLETRSAAIAREQEFLADRCAAAVTASRTAADTLVAIEIGTHLLENIFWPAMFDSVELQEEPPRPFARMCAEFDTLANDSFRAELLAIMLKSSTGCHDTHPSLRERLQALDEVPRVPGASECKAGDAYLGSWIQTIAGQLDDEWQMRHRHGWQERYAKIRNAHHRLAELEAQTLTTAEGMFERATLLDELGKDADALATYQAAAEMDSDHARAALAAGRMLLSRGEEAGATMVERSMEVDDSLVPEACALLVSHYQQRSRPADAQRYRARATRHATRVAIETAERTTATALDRLSPHDMGCSELASLVAALQREPEVLAALLARKHLRHSSGSLLVLGLITDRNETNDLVNRIRATRLLPADAHVIVLDRDQRSLRCALEALRGSQIYTV